MKLWSKNHDLSRATSIIGTIGTPGDASGSLTVGAIQHWDWRSNSIASYSSLGPTADGRIKPDIVAPAGVSTVSYGTNGFSGTSAAAPHVAAAAALIKSANPSLSADHIESTLLETATDVGPRGKDNTYGVGKLLLPRLESISGLTITSATSRVKYGDTMTIRGTGFGSTRGASKVVFFSRVEPRSWEYTRWTNTRIDVRVPTGARTGNVQVITSQGSSNTVRTTVISPWIRSISSSSVKSSDRIVISGSNFGSTRGSSWVEIGGKRVTEFARWANTSITAVVPRDSRSGNVRISTGNGLSNSVRIQVTSPYILSLSPTEGSPGTQITIRGGNYGSSRGSGYVSFSGRRPATADYISWRANMVQVKIPDGARTGDLQVVTTNGESGTRRLEVKEEFLSLPHTGVLGYNPPTVTGYPQKIQFAFDGIGRPLALTYDIRLIDSGEVQMWVNGQRVTTFQASEGWSGWFTPLSTSRLRSGQNVIEFRNTTNAFRSQNFVTWEIRDIELWKPYNAKIAIPSGYNSTTPVGIGMPYPSPFNSSVTIPFFLADEGHMQISVYNLAGQLVSTITDATYSPGVHSIVWDGRVESGHAASGTYLVRIKTEGFQEMVRVVLVR